MTWTTPAAILAPEHTLSPDDQACVEDTLDAAAEWHAGTMPWNVAANVGDIERRTEAGTMRRSSPWTRAVALRFTPRDDPRWPALYALCGEINRRLGYHETRQGSFTSRELDDLREHHERSERFTVRPDPWE